MTFFSQLGLHRKISLFRYFLNILNILFVFFYGLLADHQAHGCRVADHWWDRGPHNRVRLTTAENGPSVGLLPGPVETWLFIIGLAKRTTYTTVLWLTALPMTSLCMRCKINPKE